MPSNTAIICRLVTWLEGSRVKACGEQEETMKTRSQQELSQGSQSDVELTSALMAAA